MTEMSLPRISYISRRVSVVNSRPSNLMLPLSDETVRVEQLQDAHRGYSFPGSGFTDDTERLSSLNGVGNAIHSLDDTVLRSKECV